MNHNRHIQYRKSIYRKRRIRAIIIAGAVILVLLALLFLIIGNVFFDKSNDNDETTDTDAVTEPKDFSIPADSVRQIKGTAVTLDGKTLNELYSSLDKAQKDNFGAISVMMNAQDGKLYHYSKIAERLGYSIKGDSDIAVERLATRADSRSLYVSGIYHVSSFSESDDLARSVALAELATVISEALRAGLDEVILLAPSISAEQYGDVLHLVSEIRSFVPDAVIGFALPDALVGSADAKTIDELANSVSFLALDLRNNEKTDVIEFVETKTGEMLYSLLRYKMRVLVPYSEDTEIQAAITSALESSGVGNWQICDITK